MKRSTVETLHRINRDFYQRRAAEFSLTRRRPWPGWRRALEAYLVLAADSRSGWILDLGCGNGRLWAFLAPHLGRGHRFLGLDASLSIIAEARRLSDAAAPGRFALADLVDAPWPLAERVSRPTWIAAFGLLHHIAGSSNRRAIMRRIGALLRPGGLASVSFWQFAARRRFLARRVEWAGVDRAELEEGDHLLRWGSGEDLRYCHHASDAEVTELVASSGLGLLATYRSDGKGGDLNRYVLLTKQRSSSAGVARDR